MIRLTHLAPDNSVLWAVPLSGYGHVADEQPLPYLHLAGDEATPRFGGEASQAGCGLDSVGLPQGKLAEPWPWRQRLFNLPRRNVNQYWRNLTQSRCRSGGTFHLLEQLRFRAQGNGFVGNCPLLTFDRQFELTLGRITVIDTLLFRRPLSFAWFAPVVIPLFADWTVTAAPITGERYLLTEGFRLEATGKQRSAAGQALLWQEMLRGVRFRRGDRLSRCYHYVWEPR